MGKLISIIVPIYKVENYLIRCIESIVCQTYENIEIILVDDGSPDKCPMICDEWAKKDEKHKSYTWEKWRTIRCKKCRYSNSTRRISFVCRFG
ncbi:MAG: glycosyltransferase family 2 protein [Ruminococcus sp.]